MAAWFWAVLLRRQSGRAFNVCSYESLSISDLARRVCRGLSRPIRVKILKEAKLRVEIQHYVPDVSRARTKLVLSTPLFYDEAIAYTARWHCGGCAR